MQRMINWNKYIFLFKDITKWCTYLIGVPYMQGEKKFAAAGSRDFGRLTAEPAAEVTKQEAGQEFPRYCRVY